jgi:DNA processing protein
MSDATGAGCRECARRSWLLGRLSVLLDFRSRDEQRLLELLALTDQELIQAIAGRRRTELRERWERFEPAEPTGEDTREAETVNPAPGIQAVCVHSPDYPSALREAGPGPRMLHLLGGRERLRALTSGPAVAIVGSRRPTDYGMEMARGLARGLAASGVTIVSGLANGIAAAAHDGALEAQGPTVTVMAGGVDVLAPASRRGLYERVIERGCAVAEPPCGTPVRRWCEPARARTIAGLAALSIVVEADIGPGELTVARAARMLGRTVAALPGRVSSPVSRGTNALLMSGAPLVRGPADALDLLYGARASWTGSSRMQAPWMGALRSGEREDSPPGSGGQRAPDRPGPRSRPKPATPARAGLEPRLQAVLEQVGAGRDTPGRLAGAGVDPGEAMLALSELELMGLLGRGDGGRYVPRESLAGW